MKERRLTIERLTALSIRKQCDLLSIHRSGIYYKPSQESQENLEIMRLMDEHYFPMAHHASPSAYAQCRCGRVITILLRRVLIL